MRNIITIVFLSFSLLTFAQTNGEKYFLTTESVIPWNGKTPQAPRISPDGNKLLYELYSKGSCEIVLCNSDGSNCSFLTRGTLDNVENAFWHPSQNYIAFNQMPNGTVRNGNVYIAELKDNKLGKWITVDNGARAQFSKPNGHVLFYENTVDLNTSIKYRILGQNPIKPIENNSLELRGPIQTISKNEELSHPSLAPDGTTIVFAARTSTSGVFLNEMNITDGHRQRAVSLWTALVYSEERKSITDLQAELDNYLNSESSGLDYNIESPFIYKDNNIEQNRIKEIIANSSSKPCFIESYTQKDFLVAWLLGLFGKYDKQFEQAIQSSIYSRLWVTNIFGANIVPLVPDEANIPLPQKWSSVSSSGDFAVFEAGHYKNRHIYLISLKTKKVLKLTTKGSYNSSPEISADEKWLYYETNRSGKKEIWRAELNLKEIKKAID